MTPGHLSFLPDIFWVSRICPCGFPISLASGIQQPATCTLNLEPSSSPPPAGLKTRAIDLFQLLTQIVAAGIQFHPKFLK
jgi:hypothetical protein